MTYLVTFLEGVITFISPCLLPLLPVYIAYFAGGVAAKPGAQSSIGHTLLSALGFVAGFTLLFTLMGAFAGSVGGFFSTNQAVLNLVCGSIVIFFGLHFAGIVNIPVLQKTLRLKAERAPRGFFSSALFGVVFAIGWTPCVGAFLASALALAASTASTVEGVLLLVCYSLGLGIPFLLTALLIDQLEGAFAWVKQHYQVINVASGILLIVVGILMATGQMGKWLAILAG